MEIQLQELPHDFGCPSPVFHPLESLNDNRLNGLHDEVHSPSYPERGLWHINMTASDHSLLKPTLAPKTDGDNERVPGGSKKAEGSREFHQSLKHVANSPKKTLKGDKENMGWNFTFARQTHTSRPKVRHDVSSSPDLRRLQEKNEADCGKAVHKNKDISAQTHFERRSRGLSAEKKQVGFGVLETTVPLLNANTPTSAKSVNQEESMDFMVQEHTFLDSMMVSQEMMRTPLLGRLPTRSDDQCTWAHRHNELNSLSLYDSHTHDKSSFSVLGTSTTKETKSASNCEDCCDELMEGHNAIDISLSHFKEVQCIHEQHPCDPEEIDRDNHEYMVVFFAVHKKGRFHKIDLLKFPSLCKQYAHRISAWITSFYREQRIKACLQHLQEIFSFSPRGFVRLKTQHVPELSAKPCLRPSWKKSGSDDELRAVLMKINEVMGSMPRTCPKTAEAAVEI